MRPLLAPRWPTRGRQAIAESALARNKPEQAGALRYLTIVGLVFLALMLTLEPDVGFTAPLAARALFWTLQIVAGLVVLQWLLGRLAHRFGAGRLPCWALVLLSGVLGSIVLAPLYWLIGELLMEDRLGYGTPIDLPRTGFDGVALSHFLLNEYLDIVGPVTAAWALICLPRLHWLMPPMLKDCIEPALEPPPRPAHCAPRDCRFDPVIGPSVCPVIGPSESSDAAPDASSDGSKPATMPDTGLALSLPRTKWLEHLPAALGTDVIAVASELQYLRVWTSRGCALILGALVDVETESAPHGLRVHRSWWVASAHVVSVRRTAAGTVCLMSDGRQVPVSRRRRATVVDRFGDRTQLRVRSESG
jgi:hypothetical protein